MRGTLISLIVAFGVILAGCSSDKVESAESDFDENGNFTRADEMQEEWCEYNKGRDFAEKQCAEYWNEES